MRIPCNWASLLVISLSVLPRAQAQPRALEVGGTSSAAKLDADGEPLPPGAICRLGTRNWRHRGEGFSICYSPDSKKIAFTSRYSDVFVMNAKTGQREFAGKLKLKDGSSLRARRPSARPSDGFRRGSDRHPPPAPRRPRPCRRVRRTARCGARAPRASWRGC